MTRRERIILFLLWAFATAVNLTKPFHIDDPVYLSNARWIWNHPLHPMSGIFNGHGFPERFAAMNYPPLMSYLIAPWGALFGYSEIAMHVLMSFFTLGAIVMFFLLARRFAQPVALWLTAAFALGPAVVVSQNMMLDIPLLFLWQAFFYCLIRAYDEDFATRWLVRAGLFASAACLVKYSSLVLIAIVVVEAVRQRKLRVCIAAAIPLSVLCAWSLFNLYDYGGIHILSRPRGTLTAGHLFDFTGAWLVDLGAIVPFTLSLCTAFFGARWRWRRPFGWLAMALPTACLPLAALYAWRGFIAEQRTNDALRILFFANAALLIALVAWSVAPKAMRHIREHLRGPLPLLALWAAATSVFYIALSPGIAVRHVLLILPPVLLLAGANFRRPISIPAAALGLLPTIALTILLGISDWQFANFYRISAAYIGRRYAGHALYFSANWGWRWYAEANGMKTFDNFNPPIRPGDILALPLDIGGETTLFTPVTGLELIRQPTGPWTLFCTAAPSRFYATTAPEDPWELTRSCSGRIRVARVETGASGQ